VESIQLWFRGEMLSERPLAERPLDVGSGEGCAIVVPGAVMDRQLVIRAEGGTVMAYDLRGDPRRRSPNVLGRRVPFAIGGDYSLLRVTQDDEPRTSRVLRPPLASRRFRVRIGGVHSERAIEVGPGPVTVGRSERNTVRVVDPAVSERHLVLEPAGAFVRVVDSGSRNGTFLDGERIESMEIGRRARLRIGSTEVVLEPIEAGADDFVVGSDAMRDVVERIDRAARLPFPVLLLGDTGVGKEVLAARLHARSARSSRPFVAVDVSAIPDGLVGAELFGYERGAFTGAVRAHRGAFEQADSGTLFLDEIGELTIDLQARLLRVLETLEVRKLGSETTRRLDVRVVAATHRPLAEMVADGRFRRDLYARLAQLPISIPRLAARPDDILPIARAILARHADSLGPRELTREAEASLLVRSFPGNVRDLRNLLIGAATRSSCPTIDASDLAEAEVPLGPACSAPLDAASAAARHGGNVAAAARALGIPRTTLRDRLRRDLSG